MRIGIDASNIRGGGGVTHLLELLRAANPQKHGFDQVFVWAGAATLAKFEKQSWLHCMHDPLLEGSLLHRVYWQRFKLVKSARELACDILFVPGGSDASGFHPTVTMSQNMLPFEGRELRRFGWSWMTCKLMLLRYTQSRSFCRADGVIFLTQYAHDVVSKKLKIKRNKTKIIPHGIDQRFVSAPRTQRAMSQYSEKQPFRILYVSIVDVYKHQWNVAVAVAQLRASGYPVVLDLIGPSYPPALKKLKNILCKVDPRGECIHYYGAVPYAELHMRYLQADLCVFASSCENLPNILLEGMAAGLPIACSSRGPMPEVLGDGGLYFDPENVQDIAQTIRSLLESPDLRERFAKTSFSRSEVYSWQRCAEETFQFFAQVARM